MQLFSFDCFFDWREIRNKLMTSHIDINTQGNSSDIYLSKPIHELMMFEMKTNT